jgi:OmpA-OmpF porin, OOP family
MDFFLIPLLAALGFFALLSDKPTERVTLLPNTTGGVGAVLIKTATEEKRLDTEFATADVSPKGRIILGRDDAAAARVKYASTLAALPPPPVSFTVYFVFGSDTELTPESRPVLEQLKAALLNRPAPEIMVIGHTDRVGKLEDNDALSLRRAHSVRSILVALGLLEATFEVAGRGEREPLVPTADEVAEEKNRRVEINLR